MSRMIRILACLALALTGFLAASPLPMSASQSTDGPTIDLANIPLTPEQLPEAGYQVLTGGFLDLSATAQWVASPRQMAATSTDSFLTDAGWASTYVLDLVLLEDRASATSDILGLVQTNVYLFMDDDGAEEAYETMSDFDANDDVDADEPAIHGGVTVHIVTGNGDTMRSLVQVDRMVLEVVSLEGIGQVEPELHQRVMGDSYDRLVEVQAASGAGIAPRALQIRDGEDVPDLLDTRQSGVHQLYRLRDGNVQPAAGELEGSMNELPGPGPIALYHGSQGVEIGSGASSGAGFYSSWIGEFSSSEDATSFIAAFPESSEGALLPDPYYLAWSNETTTSQGVVGLYRVTGLIDEQPFSGTLEIRQQDNYVIGIGWRTVGDTLPSVDVTSRLMDAQLACLETSDPCTPVGAHDLITSEQEMATPVVPVDSSGNTIQSDEFGWSLPVDGNVWSINEQFAEPGYDFVELQSGQSLVTLESVIDQHGDPQQCVVDELNDLQEREADAVIDPGSDVAGEQPTGTAPGRAWAIYSVEPLADERADQEYTIRIDCYTLIDGSASLVMTHMAPHDLWFEESNKGDEIRATLQIPIVRMSHDMLALNTWYWRCDMYNRYWIGQAA